jgi:uncharacterized membrane protein (DUF485 family)
MVTAKVLMRKQRPLLENWVTALYVTHPHLTSFVRLFLTTNVVSQQVT